MRSDEKFQEAFYYLTVDKDNKTATLNFPQKSITVHGLKELEILADVTEKLNQILKKLLRADFLPDCNEADFVEAIDLSKMPFLDE
ncbi:MAG: hypothetical protein IJ597_02730 [Synergistaceae bacterium]|nr:hypothetical protein [Synergistaceae bacterium]